MLHIYNSTDLEQLSFKLAKLSTGLDANIIAIEYRGFGYSAYPRAERIEYAHTMSERKRYLYEIIESAPNGISTCVSSFLDFFSTFETPSLPTFFSSYKSILDRHAQKKIIKAQFPTLFGAVNDALAAVEEAKRRIQTGEGTQLWIYGHSMGGCVALDVTTKLLSGNVDNNNNNININSSSSNSNSNSNNNNNTLPSQILPSLLILENTMRSLRAMTRRNMPFFLRFLNRVAFPNIWINEERIKEIKIPTMIISCLDDSIIPSFHSKILFHNSGFFLTFPFFLSLKFFVSFIYYILIFNYF